MYLSVCMCIKNVFLKIWRNFFYWHHDDTWDFSIRRPVEKICSRFVKNFCDRQVDVCVGCNFGRQEWRHKCWPKINFLPTSRLFQFFAVFFRVHNVSSIFFHIQKTPRTVKIKKKLNKKTDNKWHNYFCTLFLGVSCNKQSATIFLLFNPCAKNAKLHSPACLLMMMLL